MIKEGIAKAVRAEDLREAMERLRKSRGGKVFDPDCLTEDYETGFALPQLRVERDRRVRSGGG